MGHRRFPDHVIEIPWEEGGAARAIRSKRCPVCGGDGLHLFRVEVLMGKRAVVLKADERISIEKVGGNVSRGIVVRMYYSCEDAGDTYHGFLQEIEFCKGSITETTIPIYVGKDDWFSDIWRE